MDKIKKEIKSGVYLLRNKVNGKIYVGKSVDLKSRFSSYKTDEKTDYKNHNQPIIHSIRKYGWANFEIIILEESDPIFILEREAYWIKEYGALNRTIGYNICPYGTNTVGIKMSEEARKKMSIAGKGKKKNFSKEHIKNITKQITAQTGVGKLNPMYGKRHTEKTKETISQIIKQKYKDGSLTPPMLGKHPSEDHKKKMVENRDYTKSCVKIKQIDKNTGEVIKIWDSLQEAALHLGGSKKRASAISNTIKLRRQLAFGYKWEYADMEIKNPNPENEAGII